MRFTIGDGSVLGGVLETWFNNDLEVHDPERSWGGVKDSPMFRISGTTEGNCKLVVSIHVLVCPACSKPTSTEFITGNGMTLAHEQPSEAQAVRREAGRCTRLVRCKEGIHFLAQYVLRHATYELASHLRQSTHPDHLILRLWAEETYRMLDIVRPSALWIQLGASLIEVLKAPTSKGDPDTATSRDTLLCLLQNHITNRNVARRSINPTSVTMFLAHFAHGTCTTHPWLQAVLQCVGLELEQLTDILTATKASLYTDGNISSCAVCSGCEGDMVWTCDLCMYAYHPRCLPPEVHPPSGQDMEDDQPWFCPSCRVGLPVMEALGFERDTLGQGRAVVKGKLRRQLYGLEGGVSPEKRTGGGNCSSEAALHISPLQVPPSSTPGGQGAPGSAPVAHAGTLLGGVLNNVGTGLGLSIAPDPLQNGPPCDNNRLISTKNLAHQVKPEEQREGPLVGMGKVDGSGKNSAAPAPAPAVLTSQCPLLTPELARKLVAAQFLYTSFRASAQGQAGTPGRPQAAGSMSQGPRGGAMSGLRAPEVGVWGGVSTKVQASVLPTPGSCGSLPHVGGTFTLASAPTVAQLVGAAVPRSQYMARGPPYGWAPTLAQPSPYPGNRTQPAGALLSSNMPSCYVQTSTPPFSIQLSSLHHARQLCAQNRPLMSTPLNPPGAHLMAPGSQGVTYPPQAWSCIPQGPSGTPVQNPRHPQLNMHQSNRLTEAQAFGGGGHHVPGPAGSGLNYLVGSGPLPLAPCPPQGVSKPMINAARLEGLRPMAPGGFGSITPAANPLKRKYPEVPEIAEARKGATGKMEVECQPIVVACQPSGPSCRGNLAEGSKAVTSTALVQTASDITVMGGVEGLQAGGGGVQTEREGSGPTHKAPRAERTEAGLANAADMTRGGENGRSGEGVALAVTCRGEEAPVHVLEGHSAGGPHGEGIEYEEGVPEVSPLAAPVARSAPQEPVVSVQPWVDDAVGEELWSLLERVDQEVKVVPGVLLEVKVALNKLQALLMECVDGLTGGGHVVVREGTNLLVHLYEECGSCVVAGGDQGVWVDVMDGLRVAAQAVLSAITEDRVGKSWPSSTDQWKVDREAHGQTTVKPESDSHASCPWVLLEELCNCMRKVMNRLRELLEVRPEGDRDKSGAGGDVDDNIGDAACLVDLLSQEFGSVFALLMRAVSCCGQVPLDLKYTVTLYDSCVQNWLGEMRWALREELVRSEVAKLRSTVGRYTRKLLGSC